MGELAWLAWLDGLERVSYMSYGLCSGWVGYVG
jgi:hypothetical protein